MNLNVKNTWSLKTKLTIYISVILLISIWSVALYAKRILYEEMANLAKEQQFSAVSFIAAQINEALEIRFKSLAKVSSEIEPAMLSNTESLQALLEQRPLLQILFNGGVFATGRDGIAIASCPLSTGRIGVNYLDNDFISIPINDGKPMIGRPTMGKKLAAPVFSIAVPLLDTTGTVLGVLVGTINLSQPSFLDQITNNGYGKTGGYLLVAPQYRIVVTATDKRRIMTPTSAPGVNELTERFILGYEGSGILVNPLGVEVLASAKRIPIAGWFLAATLPTAEAFAPIREMEDHILAVAILLTLFAAGLTWWMLRRLLAPIFSTVTALVAITDSGQQLKPLPIVRQDEIGKLIGSFNGLLNTLAQREEAVRESEERYRSILTASPENITIADLEGRILMISPAGVTMLGYDREEELQGLRFTEFIAPEDRNRALSNLASKVRGIKMAPNEYRGLRKNGSTFDIEVNSDFIRDADGNPSKIVFVVRDITERKQSDMKLQALNEKLEMRVEERTQELQESQKQYLHAEKLSAIGKLSASIAHEFNNPLQGILSILQGVKKRATMDEEDKELLDAAISEGNRIKDLIRNLQEFNRPSSGRKALMDLHQSLDALLLLQKSDLNGRRITVVRNYAEQLPQILVVPDQIKQVLLNLLANAADACPQSGGVITISTWQKDERVGVAIKDTGIGINSEDIERIFQPFYSTKGEVKGTGLGLSVSHGIIQDHHGEIRVESQPGEGATFTVLLPIKGVEDATFATEEGFDIG